MTRNGWCGLGLLALVVLAGISVSWLYAAQSFDKLSDADRKAFTERFTKEVWPLMQRNAKDGCVGCHSGKIVSALRLTGNVEKDFHKMLKDGFFLDGDEGSLLSRVADKNPKRRMPFEKAAWTAAEIKILDDFTKAVESKQKK